MTILWQDAFDGYTSQADYQTNYVAPSISADNSHGRFGAGCASIVNYGIGRSVGSQTNIWSSFALQITSSPSSDKVIAAFGSTASSNGGIELLITYNATSNMLRVYRGYLSALLSSTMITLATGWHWFDIRHKIDASAGEVEVWVDEVQYVSLTGSNTQQNSGFNIAYAALGDPILAGSAIGYFDAWLVYDTGTTRLGDTRIDTIVPTSDATPNDGTPSTGTSHFAVVDEAQYNTSDYITLSSTSSDAEVFGTAGISDTPLTIHSIRVYSVAEKSDAGAYALKPLVVSNGTEADGSAVNLTTGWTYQSAIFDQDPHTSASWTLSTANAAKIGVKVN